MNDIEVSKEDCLDKAAHHYGYDNWIHAGFFVEPAKLTKLVLHAMEIYHVEMSKLPPKSQDNQKQDNPSDKPD